TRQERRFTAPGRFPADASHELKPPLTVLRAGVERVITTPNLPQDTLATLEETLQEIKRMTELVEALLTLARADEGIAPLHRVPVDLRGIVEEARETGELLAEQAGVRMEVTTPAEPIVVSVDATRIRQLILNLLTNAVKYTPAGGSVRLQLGPANGKLTLSVADTGIGIAPGDLPHIFDRFWRADSARTRTGERPGAGLGLAICKWIAEAHGGKIDVVSRPRRGARGDRRGRRVGDARARTCGGGGPVGRHHRLARGNRAGPSRRGARRDCGTAGTHRRRAAGAAFRAPTDRDRRAHRALPPGA